MSATVARHRIAGSRHAKRAKARAVPAGHAVAKTHASTIRRRPEAVSTGIDVVAFAILVALVSTGLVLLGLAAVSQFRLAYRISGRGTRLLYNNQVTLNLLGITLPLIALVEWLILGVK
jgi:hypothetical protein